MSTMNISLPPELRSFVEGEVASGGYSTASEYVRTLIREAQKKKARERLEQLLLEGLESESIAVTPKFWEDLRREVQQKLSRVKSDGQTCHDSGHGPTGSV